MDDSFTSLDALMPSPQGIQSAPPASPGMNTHTNMQNTQIPMSFKPSMPMMRFAMPNIIALISYFLAAAIISMSMPRNLLLQYVPNAYTTGGVVSWMGAGILGGSAVVISQMLNVMFVSMLS
jgi:hypothetical protein